MNLKETWRNILKNTANLLHPTDFECLLSFIETGVPSADFSFEDTMRFTSLPKRGVVIRKPDFKAYVWKKFNQPAVPGVHVYEISDESHLSTIFYASINQSLCETLRISWKAVISISSMKKSNCRTWWKNWIQLMYTMSVDSIGNKAYVYVLLKLTNIHDTGGHMFIKFF